MKSKRTIRTARHEAAHAVVAEYLGWRVTNVVLKSREVGSTEHRAPQGRSACPFELAMICMAGSMAETKWNRLRWGSGSMGDIRSVIRLGFGPRARGTLLMHTRAIVDELAREIQAVAVELKKRDLKGHEVRSIMRSVT